MHTKSTQSAVPQPETRFFPIAATLIPWAALIIFSGMRGYFQTEMFGAPVVLIAAVLIPPIAFAILYRSIPSVQQWTESLELTTIVAMQAWRVIGGTFIFLWLIGDLPAAFAIPAGFGDVAVGIGAALIVTNVANQTPGWQSNVRYLIFFGMLDFVAALATGVLTRQGLPLYFEGAPSADIMQSLPMVFIPGFIVPGFIILHMIAWIKLRND